MKTNNLFTLLFMALLIGLLSGCGGADINDQAPFAGSTLTHPADWVSVSAFQAKSINFHGIFVNKHGDQSCTQCHGADYKGGINGVSCYKCHNGGPTGKHFADWIDPNSYNFHGVFAATYGDQSCTACHGSNLKGGAAKVSCYACHNGPSGNIGYPPHPHPAGWGNPATESVHFHGYYAKKFSLACTACHGSDLKGGLGPSCYSCHGKLW